MKTLRTMVIISSLVLISSALDASATTLSWQRAREVTLPSGSQGIPQGYLPTLSCTTGVNCEAGGSYSDAAGNSESVVLSEVNGVWKAPRTLRAPIDAAQSPGMTIYGLSCAARIQCVAVGSYQDAAGNTQAFVDNEVNGVWAVAQRVTLPTNALISGQDALVRDVECASVGYCSAVGGYLDNSSPLSRSVGFVLSEVAGVWRRANEILVNGANFNPFVSMSQISCSAAQNCAAIGTFINANNTDEALLVDQVNGIWSSNIQLTLPKNSSPFTGVNTGEITCVRNGSCSIFGTYNTATGAVEGVSAREERGVWSKSTEIVLPANSATNPHVFLYEFQGIACSSSLNCSVGGQYQNTGGQYEGFLANEVNGTWRRASELLLPTGAVSVGKNGGVVALSCPVKGDCRAGAAYLDAQGRYQALVVNESNGVWQRGTSVLLPAGASTVGVDGGVYALSCSSPKSCTAIGSYLKNPSLYEGFTLRN